MCASKPIRKVQTNILENQDTFIDDDDGAMPSCNIQDGGSSSEAWKRNTIQMMLQSLKVICNYLATQIQAMMIKLNS